MKSKRKNSLYCGMHYVAKSKKNVVLRSRSTEMNESE